MDRGDLRESYSQTTIVGTTRLNRIPITANYNYFIIKELIQTWRIEYPLYFGFSQAVARRGFSTLFSAGDSRQGDRSLG